MAQMSQHITRISTQVIEKAKQHQSGRGDNKSTTVNFTEGKEIDPSKRSDKGRTNKELGKIAGVSHDKAFKTN